MAKFELQRSGLLSIDLDSDREDYRAHIREAIFLLKNDDERFLYVAGQLDTLIRAVNQSDPLKRKEVLCELEKIADYSRLMAGQPPRYREIGAGQHTER